MQVTVVTCQEVGSKKFQALFAASKEKFSGLYLQPDYEESNASKKNASPKIEYLVCTDQNDEMIGAIVCQRFTPNKSNLRLRSNRLKSKHSNDIYNILALEVVKEYKSRNVGMMLVRYAQSHLGNLLLQYVDDYSLEFYKACGFAWKYFMFPGVISDTITRGKYLYIRSIANKKIVRNETSRKGRTTISNDAKKTRTKHHGRRLNPNKTNFYIHTSLSAF